MDIADIIAQSSRKPQMKIRIVRDEHCPLCGRAGRPKVQDTDGTWAWKCPSTREQCTVQYYYPHDNTYSVKLSEEEDRALSLKVKNDIDELMAKSRWISQGNCSRVIPKDAPLPEGWTEGTGDF